MANYPFRSDQGEEIILEYPMVDAPDFGTERIIDGIVYKRVMSRMSMPIVEKPIRSFQIADNHPAVEHYDEESFACFENKGKAREFLAHHNDLMGKQDMTLDS